MNNIAIDLPMEKIAEFCDRWQVTEFALFGSVLRDDFRPDSDIDVMVQFHPEAHPTFSTLDQILPNISWSEINGMRNRLVHEYDDVNLNIVWDVVQSEIPSLIEELKLEIPPER